MILREISDKLLIQSASNVLDFSTLTYPGAGSQVYVGAIDGIFSYYVEGSTTDQYRILDGRGFGLTSLQSFTRAGAKIGPWDATCSSLGNIFFVGQQFNSSSVRSLFVGKLTGPHQGGDYLTRTQNSVVTTSTFPGAKIAISTVSENINVVHAQSEGPNGTIYFARNFNPSLGVLGSASNFIVQRRDMPIVNPPIIGYCPNNNTFLIVGYHFPSNVGTPTYQALVYPDANSPGAFHTVLPFYGDTNTFLNTNFPEFLAGPRSIVWNNSTSEYLVIDQAADNLNPTPQRYAIRLFRINNAGVVTANPIDLIDIPYTDNVPSSLTKIQAGEGLLLLGNNKAMFALESFSSTADTSKLVIFDTVQNWIKETIDLGMPGPVKLGFNNGRAIVLHQELSGSSADIYLRTFSTNSLPPMALSLSSTEDASSDFSFSPTISVDIGSAEQTPSKFWLSETQITSPIDPNDVNFITTSPNSFTFSGTGIKTVYSWYVNPTVSLLPNIGTIFVGQAEADPLSFTLHDSRTNAESYTNQLCLTVSFDNPPNLPVDVLISDTQITPPLPGDSRFISLSAHQSIATTCLNDFIGAHTVSLWLKNSHGDVSPTSTNAHINFSQFPTCDYLYPNEFANNMTTGTIPTGELITGSTGFDSSISADIGKDGNILVTWVACLSPDFSILQSPRIYGRLYDKNLNPLTEVTALTDSVPNYGFTGDPFQSTVYTSVTQEGNTNTWMLVLARQTDPTIDQITGWEIHFRRFDADLNPLESMQSLAIGGSTPNASPATPKAMLSPPRVKSDELGFFTIFYSLRDGRLVFQRFGNSGPATISETIIAVQSQRCVTFFDAIVQKQSGRSVIMATFLFNNSIQLGGVDCEIYRLNVSGMPEGANPLITPVDLFNVSVISPGFFLEKIFGVDVFFVRYAVTAPGNDSVYLYREYDGNGNPRTNVFPAPWTLKAHTGQITNLDNVIAFKVLSAQWKKDSEYKFLVYNGPFAETTNPLFSIYPQAMPITEKASLLEDNFFPNRFAIVPISPIEFCVFGTNLSDINTRDVRMYRYGLNDNDQIALSDTETGSHFFATSLTVTANFECPIDNICYILSETQSTQPDPSNTNFICITTAIDGSATNILHTPGLHTIHLWFKNSDDIVKNIAAQASIELYAPELMTHDRIDGSASFTKEHVVSVFFSPDGSITPAEKWLLSETQITQPTVTDSRFLSTEPVTFELATIPDLVHGENQIRTVHAWFSDGHHILNLDPSFSSINLGVPPVLLSTAVTDRFTGHDSFTTSHIVSISINADSVARDGNITGYLVKETSSTPAYNDSGFVLSAPSTFAVSNGTGLKTIYFWAKNRYTLSGADIKTITLDPNPEIMFTYVFKPGKNFFAPTLQLDREMRASDFVTAFHDVLIYQDNNFDTQKIYGVDVVGLTPSNPHWSNDTVNPPIDGARSYILIPGDLSLGQIRTLTFTGFAL